MHGSMSCVSVAAELNGAGQRARRTSSPPGAPDERLQQLDQQPAGRIDRVAARARAEAAQVAVEAGVAAALHHAPDGIRSAVVERERRARDARAGATRVAGSGRYDSVSRSVSAVPRSSRHHTCWPRCTTAGARRPWASWNVARTVPPKSDGATQALALRQDEAAVGVGRARAAHRGRPDGAVEREA